MKRIAPFAFAALILGACTSMRPLPVGSDVAGIPIGSVLRVTPVSGEPYRMTLDEIRNDTLFGYTEFRNVRVSLADIRKLDIRKVEVGKTLWVTLVPAGLLVTAAGAAFIWVLGQMAQGK